MRQFDYGGMVFSINSDKLSVTLANAILPGAFSTCTPYYNTQPMQNVNEASMFSYLKQPKMNRLVRNI